ARGWPSHGPASLVLFAFGAAAPALLLLVLDAVGLQQAVAPVLPAVDDAHHVVGVAVDEEVVAQQIHLQNGLLHAHRLDGDVLGTDHLKLRLLGHVELGGNGGDQSVLTQALAQAGAVLPDLAVNGGAGRVDSPPHIAVAGFLLGAEESAAADEGDLHHTAVVLFHGEGHKCVGVLPEVAIQLGDLLLSVGLDGIVEGHLFAGKCELHMIRSFLLAPVWGYLYCTISPGACTDLFFQGPAGGPSAARAARSVKGSYFSPKAPIYKDKPRLYNTNGS